LLGTELTAGAAAVAPIATSGVSVQAAEASGDPEAQAAAIRAYLDATVVPVLRSALREMVVQR
jgi:hypothetical protein